jgi:hypothetical protein
MELLRIDPSHHFLGLRLNAWVSILVFICAWSFFAWWQFIRRPSEPVADGPGGSGPPTPPTKRGPKKPKKKKEPSVRVKGPRMSVPKGRVRPGR